MNKGTNNTMPQQSESRPMSVKTEPIDANSMDGTTGSSGGVVNNGATDQQRQQQGIEGQTVSVGTPTSTHQTHETGGSSSTTATTTGEERIEHFQVKQEMGGELLNHDDDDEIIALDLVEQYAAVVNEATGERIDVLINRRDQTMSLSTLNLSFPGAHGLKWKVPETGSFRGLPARMEQQETKFIPPMNGWAGKTFVVIFEPSHQQPHKQPEQTGHLPEQGTSKGGVCGSAGTGAVRVPSPVVPAVQPKAPTNAEDSTDKGGILLRSSKRLVPYSGLQKRSGLEQTDSDSDDGPEEEDVQKKKKQALMYECNECPFKTYTISKFKIHRSKHLTKEAIQCAYCTLSSNSKTAIISHEKAVHKQDQEHQT